MDPEFQRLQNRPLWLDVGPRGHACHVYGDEAELLETLTGFVGGGLWTGEGVIVIATRRHVAAIEARLRESGLDLAHFRGESRYIAVSAEQTLERICIEGWPDAGRLAEVMDELVVRAGRGGRKARVYGEMVQLLWLDGRYDAAIHLEQLWNGYLADKELPLLCAYSRSGFHAAGAEAVAAVERAHTVFIS